VLKLRKCGGDGVGNERAKRECAVMWYNRLGMRHRGGGRQFPVSLGISAFPSRKVGDVVGGRSDNQCFE